MFRQITRSSAIHSRAFHSSPAARKTVTEKVAEVADTVNKKLGKGLASAIDKGEAAADATKSTMSMFFCDESTNNNAHLYEQESTTEQAKEKAGEAASIAGQKKNEVSSVVTIRAVALICCKAAASARETKDDIQRKASK
ncbi:hypothetical protein C8J57DRAFT_1041895 [Mycena rebaudengoi]|nr:hypothetical protein C8J57DRAFT_1041895 [Mycena rebaudengoi]